MDQATFTGMLISSIAALIVVIGYFGKGAWALSESITQLRETMKQIVETSKDHDCILEKHEDMLNKHDKEIALLKR